MARPKPIVLKDYYRGYYTEEILYSDSITVLTYRGRPVSYRVINTLTGTIQYPKTASTSPAFIRKLAAELNALHSTVDFEATEWKPNIRE